MKPRAAVLAVGEELVRGERPETNGFFLARRLFRRGFSVGEIAVVGDDRRAIAEAFLRLAACADFIAITGGLGPTEDDLTRHALADAAGAELVEDAEALAQVKDRLAARGRNFVPRQAQQALVPRGARVLENAAGIAPGFWGTVGRALYVALPGVPGEIEGMWEAAVRAVIDGAFPSLAPEPFRVLHLFGLPEVEVQERLVAACGAEAARRIGVCASSWVLSVYLSGVDAGQAAVAKRALAPHVFGEGDETLAEVLVRELARRGLRMAVAESLTGGGIAQAITAVPGASETFVGGAVAYTEAAKRGLGVPAELLAAHGAVSAECARSLAERARRAWGGDLGLSATGFAGPSGGTPASPVGTVYLAADGLGGADVYRIMVRGRRADVRQVAINHALAAALTRMGMPLVRP